MNYIIKKICILYNKLCFIFTMLRHNKTMSSAMKSIGAKLIPDIIDIDNFIECESCRKKTGSPTLCDSCLHNRDTISHLNKKTIELRRRNRLLRNVAIILSLHNVAILIIVFFFVRFFL